MERLKPRGPGRRKLHEAKQEKLVEIEFKRTIGFLNTLWDVENIRRGVKNHWPPILLSSSRQSLSVQEFSADRQ